MDNLMLKLDNVKSKVDLKLILSLVNFVMGLIRDLIKAKQGESTTEPTV